MKIGIIFCLHGFFLEKERFEEFIAPWRKLKNNGNFSMACVSHTFGEHSIKVKEANLEFSKFLKEINFFDFLSSDLDPNQNLNESQVRHWL